jgi:hypothetical protein
VFYDQLYFVSDNAIPSLCADGISRYYVMRMANYLIIKKGNILRKHGCFRNYMQVTAIIGILRVLYVRVLQTKFDLIF